MRKRLLSILLSLAMILTMIPMAGTVAYAADEEPATAFVINTADGEYLYRNVDEAGQVTDDKDQPAVFPDGISWDNTEKALVLDNFSGKRICTYDMNKELRIKLVGNSTLTGYYESYAHAGIFTDRAAIRVLSSSTGTLNINIESTNSVRGIMISNGGNHEINLDGGTVNLNLVTSENFVNGFYGYKVCVNNDANLNVDVKSTAASVERAYAFWADVYFRTSGTVTARSNNLTLCGTGYIAGNGNYYLYGSQSAGETLLYVDGKDPEDYALYGNIKREGLAVLGNPSVLTAVAPAEMPLAAPETNQIPQTTVETAQVMGYVDWIPAAAEFAPNTKYTAAVTLVPMPGYTFGSLSDNAFEGMFEGAASTGYENGNVAVTYPETEDTDLEVVDTAFELNGPTAGKALPKKIENEDCTGTVSWQCSEIEAKEDTVYTAVVTLSLKDGVQKRFSGVEADSYSINGITAVNEANSTTFQVTFPATGKAGLNAEINRIDCNDDTDFSKISGVSYDKETRTLILEGYNGMMIYNHHPECPIHILVKGENTITCSGVAGEKAGIYSTGGDVYINGEEDAKLNIVSDNDSYVNVRGLYTYNMKGRFFLDNVKVSITLKQSEEKKSNVMTGIYAAAFLYNGATITSNVQANCYNWYEPFSGAINIEDDSSWRPLDTSITPVSDRSGNIYFKNNELKAKYVVKESADPATKLVVKKDVSQWETELEDSIYLLNTEGVCPAFVNLDGLVEGEDYSITYENNKAAGMATATITGMGEFTGSLTKTFRIVKSYSVEDYEIKSSYKSTTYNGKTKKPTITLEGLKEGEDFTVAYSDNVNAGTAKAVVTGMGIISGTAEKTYTIKPASISGKTAALSTEKYTYSGKAKKPTVTITGLKSGTDFTAAYKDNVNAGTATVTITGKGNYTGTIEKTYTIEPASISGKTVTLSASSFTYNGIEKKPAAAIEGLTEGVDFTVAYSNNINAGTATVTLTGMGNYAGTVEKTFTIKPVSITGKTAALSATKYVYSGAAKKPTVTITGLKSGTDFTVAYKNNVKTGKATVTITGKGNYTGTITKTFVINPMQAAISTLTVGTGKLTVKMSSKPSAKGATTYQIGYKKKGSTKWVYTTTTAQSKIISGLKKGKIYQVKVRAYSTVNSVKYYGAWSKTKTSAKIK